MPPYPRRQPILLDEGALNDALRRKGSQRPNDDDLLYVDPNNDTQPIPVSGPIRGPTYFLKSVTSGKRQRGTGPMLLDENKLQRALKSKAEKRKAAQLSAERRKLALSSMDKMIDSSSVVSATNKKDPQTLPKRKVVGKPTTTATSTSTKIGQESETSSATIPRESAPTRKSLSELHPRKPVSPRQTQTEVVSKPTLMNSTEGSAPSKNSTNPPRKRKPKPTVAANTRNHLDSASAASSITEEASNRSLTRKVIKKKVVRRVKEKREDGSTSTANEDATAPIHTPDKENGIGLPPRPVRKVVKMVSSRRPKQTDQEISMEPSSAGDVRPTQVIKLKMEKNGTTGSARTTQLKQKKTPSKRSIVTESTAKRSWDSVSSLEDATVISNISEPTVDLAPMSNHSQVKPSSNHSQDNAFRKTQPVSWSIRNEEFTGFSPNQYITKETMTHYTENLGGVETVATTTKIFFDKVKHDKQLKGFFRTTKWEHVRNEFIILANLEVPHSFDESIKGVLEHHCKFLENGANLDRLISIWESAIESSWMDHQMDDARQLIVGPSRVIFNLKALERHYAMYQKAQRTTNVSDSKRGSKGNRGIFGRIRGGQSFNEDNITKKKDKKKQVRFRISHFTYIDPPPAEDPPVKDSDLFYTKEELEALCQENKAIIQCIQCAAYTLSCDEVESPTRGLESHTYERCLERYWKQRNALQFVFREQERQRIEVVYEPEALAETYALFSESSRQEASFHGAEDEGVARKAMGDELKRTNPTVDTILSSPDEIDGMNTMIEPSPCARTSIG